MLHNYMEADVLIVGGGAAGIWAAITAAERGCRVVVLSKGPVARTGITPLAGEGIQASFGEGDSPETHFQDTVKAGRNLGDAPLVKAMADETQGEILRLIEAGHKFRRKEDGTFVQSFRPGQSRTRSIYSVGGGWGMMRAMLLRTADFPNLMILQDVIVLRLAQEGGRVQGAVYLDVDRGNVGAVRAGATIMATGGYEQIWRHTACPEDSTGEGHMLALEAGATLADIEMVQFYPVVFVWPSAIKRISIQYEYLLNPDVVGGRLLNGKGDQFIQGFPMRDELTHAIYREIEEGRASSHGGVYVDLTQSRYGREEVVKRLRTWTPIKYAQLCRLGVDISEKLGEVAPGAHFCCGGIYIDEKCQTGVPGLFAAGECAGNVQGANRMSGNAIAETLVFGRRAGEAALEYAMEHGDSGAGVREAVCVELDRLERLVSPKRAGIRPCHLKRQVKSVVWSALGPTRSREGLELGVETIRGVQRQFANLVAFDTRGGCYEIQEAYEVEAMARLGECVMLAALSREESRGAHKRSDFPQTSEIPVHTIVRKDSGELIVGSAPVRAAAESSAELDRRRQLP